MNRMEETETVNAADENSQTGQIQLSWFNKRSAGLCAAVVWSPLQEVERVYVGRSLGRVTYCHHRGGELALLAGRREGFRFGASGFNLSLELGDLEADKRAQKFTTGP